MADHPDLMQWLGVEAPAAAVETVNDEEVDRLKRTNEMQTLRVAEVEEEKARLTERLEAQETELEIMRLEIARLLMELEAANEGRQELMDRVEGLEAESAAAREAIVETERALKIKDEEMAALRVELQQRQEEAGELGRLRAQLEEERYRSEEAMEALRREGEKALEEARRREEEARKEQRRETEALQRAMDAQRAQFVEMQEENRKMAKRAEEMSVELAESKKKAEKLEEYRKFKKMYEDERRKSASLERELREATELLHRPKAPEETGPREMKQSSSGIPQSKPWMNVFDRLHLDAIDRVTRKQGLAERWCEKLMARVSERLLTMLSDEGAPRRAPRKVRGRNHFVRRQQIESDREAWQRMLASDSSGDDFSDDELDTAAVSCSSLHEPSTEFRRMLRKSSSKRRRKGQTLPTIMQDPLRVQDSGNYETYSQSQSLLVRQLADCIVAKLVEPAVEKSHCRPDIRRKTPEVGCVLPAIVSPKRRPCPSGGFNHSPRLPHSRLDMTCELHGGSLAPTLSCPQFDLLVTMPIEDGQLVPEEWQGSVINTAIPVVDPNGVSERVTAADSEDTIQQHEDAVKNLGRLLREQGDFQVACLESFKRATDGCASGERLLKEPAQLKTALDSICKLVGIELVTAEEAAEMFVANMNFASYVISAKEFFNSLHRALDLNREIA
ncbi:hypothetical protein FOZ60_014375 [Perkinsus olseni]|uniref:Uncharacterized protein n=2 Tax=Perkinsus olseni TaxID=32597 RepID=A0A7J6N8M7_PEROL|nr:hypothetical protein FOZ60_014375 [Perkinsus olseni]